MNQQKVSKWAWACIGFGIVGAIVLLGAGYGYQWGWWQLGTAFTWLLPASAVLGLIGFSLAVIFGFVKWNDRERGGTKIVAMGLLLSFAVLGTIGYWFNEAQKYPPIHDITTDIQNPPRFKGIVPLRADARNDTTYGDQDKADLQREAYPDVQTLYLDVNYDTAFDRALQAARQMPWEKIVTKNKEEGLIEAVDELPWFGFKDDVVIRVDTAESASRCKIDVRSVSRIGKGDIGVNAQRIRDYLRQVEHE